MKTLIIVLVVSITTISSFAGGIGRAQVAAQKTILAVTKTQVSLEEIVLAVVRNTSKFKFISVDKTRYLTPIVCTGEVSIGDEDEDDKVEVISCGLL